MARVKAETASPPRRYELDPADVTVLMGFDADLRGDLREFPGWPKGDAASEWVEEPDRSRWSRYGSRSWWVENWKTPEDALVWNVDVPKGDYYNVYMVGTGQNAELKVTAGKEETVGWVNNGLDVMWDIAHYPPQAEHSLWRWQFTPPRDYFRLVWSGWDRIPMGSLYLPAGATTIDMTANEAGEDLGLYSLELVPVGAEEVLTQRARALRSDAAWFADARYGLFFHWCSSVYPRHGEKKPFPENVDAFDVDAFVKMVEETGATYIIFVTTWAEHTFPAPIDAIDSVLPGRTSQRDLIMEIADGLNKRGIRLLLYYHCGPSDPEWWKEAEPNFAENWCAIMNEVGERYGEKVEGYWFDCGGTYYQLNVPFERLTKAAKAGNPNRLISYNTGNFFPKFTDFQDYAPGEGPHFCTDQSLLRYLPKGGSGVFTGGRHAGLQSQVCFGLERNGWVHTKRDAEIMDPFWTRESLTELLTDTSQRRCPLSIGIEVYEDGTASAQTIELLRGVREDIWR